MEKHRSFRHPLIAEDGVRCAHVHPVAGEDRDRYKDQLRELPVLGGLGHRLIDVSKHRYDGDKMNNAKNDPFCAGFHKVVPYANSVEACARVASRFALNVGLLANVAAACALSAGRIARSAGRIAQLKDRIARTEGAFTETDGITAGNQCADANSVGTRTPAFPALLLLSTVAMRAGLAWITSVFTGAVTLYAFDFSTSITF